MEQISIARQSRSAIYGFSSDMRIWIWRLYRILL